MTGGHVNTVRANADAIAALPDDEFRRDDLCPALRETLGDLMSTPIIETVEQIREGQAYRNIYAVSDDACRLAEEAVAQRDAVCPCGHAGLRNRGDFYECSFDGCSQQFDREHLATVEVRADGGTERLPWCDNCEAFAVPEDGVCGVCGTEIRHREEVP